MTTETQMCPPLVSIIVINYNYDRFLREAVDSALGQTYTNTEVIVVDDGSVDASRDMIAAYGQAVAPVLKENGGQASAFNAGFEKSSGQFVLFLDSDDMLMPTAAETAVGSLINSDAVKLHWQLREIDASGKTTGRLYPNQAPGAGDLREHIIHRGPNSYVSPPTSGNVWMRSFLEKVLPVSECGDKHGADAYLSMLAPLFGPIKRAPEPQSYYRVHGENFSGHSVLDRIAHDLRRYDNFCRIMSEHLRRMGIRRDPNIWKGPDTVYAWMEGVRAGTEQVKSLVLPGEAFILVDDAQWGYGDIIADRRCIPFLERNGQYWGPPVHDASAIDELERLRQSGASAIVFAPPGFWWLGYYRGLHDYLRSKYQCVLNNESLVVFDLRSEWEPTAAMINSKI